MATLWGGARGGADTGTKLRPSPQFSGDWASLREGGGFWLRLRHARFIGVHLWLIFFDSIVGFGGQCPPYEVAKNSD